MAIGYPRIVVGPAERLKYSSCCVVHPVQTSVAFIAALAALSCRPAPTITAPPAEPASVQVESEAEGPPRAEAPVLSELLADMVLVQQESTVVELEFFDEVCSREGFPETLTDAAAAELGDAKPGSLVTIVHDEGQISARVASAGCQEAEEYVAESATLLTLDQPAGHVSGSSHIPRMLLPPNLAFVGSRPSASARLEAPRPMAWESPLGKRVHDLVSARVDEIVVNRTEACREEIDEGEMHAPTAAAAQAAIGRLTAWHVAAASPVVWVLIEDPAITFTCYSADEFESVGVLIDVDTGLEVAEFESNNGVELVWVTDIDGDGTQEGLVDVQWLEDGGHEIILLRHDDEGWGEVSLYSFDGP
jgi:hypothetical protein